MNDFFPNLRYDGHQSNWSVSRCSVMSYLSFYKFSEPDRFSMFLKKLPYQWRWKTACTELVYKLWENTIRSGGLVDLHAHEECDEWNALFTKKERRKKKVKFHLYEVADILEFELNPWFFNKMSPHYVLHIRMFLEVGLVDEDHLSGY